MPYAYALTSDKINYYVNVVKITMKWKMKKTSGRVVKHDHESVMEKLRLEYDLKVYYKNLNK